MTTNLQLPEAIEPRLLAFFDNWVADGLELSPEKLARAMTAEQLAALLIHFYQNGEKSFKIVVVDAEFTEIGGGAADLARPVGGTANARKIRARRGRAAVA